MCCSGSLLAVVAGLLYGSSFIPVLYVKYHAADSDSQYRGASQFGKSIFIKIQTAVMGVHNPGFPGLVKKGSKPT